MPVARKKRSPSGKRGAQVRVRTPRKQQRFVIQEDDVECKALFERLLIEGYPADKRHRSVVDQYTQYCGVNARATDAADSLGRFGAARLRQGLVPNGIRSTMASLLRALKPPSTTQIILRALARRGLASRVNHARDLSPDEIVELLQAMWDQGFQEEAIAAYFMWITGLRFETIQEVRWVDLIFRKGVFQVDISKSKTIQAQRSQTTWSIAVQLIPAGPVAVVNEFAERASRTSTCLELALGAFSRDHLNKVVKQVAYSTSIVMEGNEGPARVPTSYTFRRSAMHRFLEHCRGEDGVIDWKKATTLTLHHSEKVLKSAYAQRASDVRALEDTIDGILFDEIYVDGDLE
jgi:integrase